ncbi:MAG TPA: FAD-dependent oxidoreductase [Bacillota bacterium]|nr:FAD-dependent oxidoreductase [Bacillota bacterium]HNT02530.1 FAD-dependent oxidoreductase [Bacillota bacterium]HPA55238.1 FAD-dependent oxidoreductase [Bacillota bacterium]HQA65769.1 FAD-dependent oxidoreductase [Bacillota bacterium]HQO41507.1 FAD-dependent oxidoreductase [Bacillota bacterium]
MDRRIVIAGGGIAGLNAAKSAREQDPDCSIVILEALNTNTYVRTRLPDYISGTASYKEIFPYDDSWYEKNRINLKKDTRITGIDAAHKTIITDKGNYDFDSLVIALGSSGNIPPIPGAKLENCFPVRTVADADKIRSLSCGGKICTIIGGGLLGLEMAWAIRQLGCDVNVIHNSGRLLPKQIDEEGAKLLYKAISNKGINLYMNAQVQEIGGENRAEYVRLDSGTVVKSDFVILSVGVNANTQPLKDSGINMGRSVAVDKYMETNIEGIYAAGDVAEYNGKCYGIWPIAVEQGKIAGTNAAGGKLEYSEIHPFTSLKIKGITMFSIGDVFSEDSLSIAEADFESGRYIKLLIKDSIIIGAIVFGDSNLPMKIKKAVDNRIRVPEIKEGITIKELIL